MRNDVTVMYIKYVYFKIINKRPMRKHLSFKLILERIDVIKLKKAIKFKENYRNRS